VKRIDDLTRIKTGLPDEFLLWMKEHESELFDFMTGKGHADRIMIDVGAHAGKWAVQFADEWNRVLALEPNPVTFRALCDVVVHYGAKNVVPVCAGAGEHTGILPLTVYVDRPSAANFVGHHEWWPDEKIAGTWPALVLALDVFAKSFEQPVGFIKIDTEGADLSVLLGARELLAAQRPMLLIELHESPGEDRAGEIVKIITEAGYAQDGQFFQYGDMRYLFMDYEGPKVARGTNDKGGKNATENKKAKGDKAAEKETVKNENTNAAENEHATGEHDPA
jgi:FkbM family methyltransferase